MKKILLSGMTFMFLGVSQQVMSMNQNWYFNLQAAAKANDYNSIPYLIDKVQYNVNFQDGAGETALHIAALEGHSTFIEKLIEKTKANIKVNLKNNTGQTPLHYTVLGKADSPASVDFLFDNGADLNAHDKTGNTPLHFAAMLGKINIAGKLIELKADVNAKADDKKTPLHYAALGKAAWSFEIAKELIKNGAIINAGDKDGTTPLHIAADQGALEIAEELITHGAKVNALDNDPDTDFGGTPLHYAAHNGHLDIVQELVNNYGADVTIKNNKGLTPLDVATDENVKNFLKSPTTKTSSTFINLKQYFTPINVGWDYNVGWLQVPDHGYAHDEVLIHIFNINEQPHIDSSGTCNFEYVCFRSLLHAIEFLPITIVDDPLSADPKEVPASLYYWKSWYEHDKNTKTHFTFSYKPGGPFIQSTTPDLELEDVKKVFLSYDFDAAPQHASPSLWGIKKPQSDLEKALTLLKEKLTTTSDYLQKLKQKLIELTSKLSGKVVSTTFPKTTTTKSTIITSPIIPSKATTKTTPIIPSSGTKKTTTTTTGTNDVYITLVNGDIVKQQFADNSHAAIVNAANTSLIGSSGIAKAIQDAAGQGLINEIKKMPLINGFRCPTGEARLTGGHKLSPLRILHAVGPSVGATITNQDENLLASTYQNCLILAEQNAITAIAFCCISTEIFNYNIGQATPLALNTVFKYLTTQPTKIQEIRFIVFSAGDYDLYAAMLLNSEHYMKNTLQGSLKKFQNGSYNIDINFDTVKELHQNYSLTQDNSAIPSLKLTESTLTKGKSALCFKLTKK